MNDAAVRQILDEIQKSKGELKNTIFAKVENSALKNKLEILERDNKLINIVIFRHNKTNEEVQANTIADELKELLEIELSDRDIIDELERNGIEETKIIKENSQPATPTQNLFKEYDSLEELNYTEKLDHPKFPKENKKGKLYLKKPSSIKLRSNSSSTHTQRGK
ncbi:hypothetical protein JTB14_007605 [Gonioctena quinquepunctata]|nr:hypothetical protein JTB14_007605 [Gonioctena quinquepunctata]